MTVAASIFLITYVVALLGASLMIDERCCHSPFNQRGEPEFFVFLCVIVFIFI